MRGTEAEGGMPTPVRPATALSRRGFLLGALTFAAFSASCVRVPERAALPSTPAATPELDGWRGQATAMLGDALQTLRSFDVFAAYRISTTPDSGRRSNAELVWDPPTGAEWDAATHVAHSLRGRADQLFQAVTNAQVDASIWREQRTLADVAHDIGDLSDALAAYRDRLDGLRPGDASAALALLDNAWANWEQIADRIGLSRAEAINCAS
jgi:hypothetical protein